MRNSELHAQTKL